ncbi:hypothetical protein IEO21_05849 [Rhodonia placenta]|uniref:Uncharacterized protein n=1 Tax=Rhodonia placenta TaxID=104341 RepID=A0A8H7P130_9APHY|nr:hypothetical protein IEO21_05849 [Postia placenta]
MSLTSHDNYPIARRHAFSVVTMQNNAIIVRICTYMLDDIPGRLHWVRELKVCFIESCNTAARLLVPLLENAIHLKSLQFPYSVDVLLLTQPRIAPALSALHHLQILHLTLYPDSESKAELFAIQREMLREMRSRPVELSLWIPSSSDLSCIQHIQTIKRLTLERLKLHNEEYPNYAQGSQHLLSWPTASSLTLDRCRLSMSEAVQAFPNVRELRVECPFDSNSTSSVCWPHMDYVGGPIELFEKWSFNCYVHHLSITSALYLDSAYDVTVLNTIRHTSPRILALSVFAEPELAGTFWGRLAETAPQIRSLEISIFLLWREMDLVLKMAQQLVSRSNLKTSSRMLTVGKHLEGHTFWCTE